jgi:hypothetical protein
VSVELLRRRWWHQAVVAARAGEAPPPAPRRRVRDWADLRVPRLAARARGIVRRLRRAAPPASLGG